MIKPLLISISVITILNYYSVYKNGLFPFYDSTINRIDSLPKRKEERKFTINGKKVTNNQMDSVIDIAIKETIKKLKVKSN